MIRFGSRGSELALWQTRFVATAIEKASRVPFTTLVIKTAGDRIQDQPLSQVEGKGFFTREIEEALLGGRIDAAVHSMKDLPTESTPGLVVGAVVARNDPADCLVVRADALAREKGLLPLRAGARVGTSSLRRRAFLLELRKDLEPVDMRGNVTTRVQRLREGRYDAIVLARAGLDRLQLDLAGLVLVDLPVGSFLPAPAQGALAVQVRADDARARDLVRAVDSRETAEEVAAERALLGRLGGGCSVPLGVLVSREAGSFRLRAAFFGARSPVPLRVELSGPDADVLATEAARRLLPARTEPLRGRSVLLVRPADADKDRDVLAEALRAAGAEPEPLSLTRLVPLEPVRAELADLGRHHWIAVTSRKAALRLAETLGPEAATLRAARFGAVGEATADALRAAGLCDDPLVPARQDGRGLAEAMLAAGCGPGTPVLFPCAEEARDELPDALRAAGVPVTRLVLYRSVRLEGKELPGLPRGEFDAAVFTSPSGADAFFALRERPRFSQAVAIGRATAKALERHGVARPRVPATPAPHDLIDELIEAMVAP